MTLDLSSPEPSDDADAYCYIVEQHRLYLEAAAPPFSLPRVSSRRARVNPAFRFLGLLGDVPCYACNAVDLPSQDGALTPVSLRQLLGNLDDAQFCMASRAMQVLTWHANHRFCSRCGAPTTDHQFELAKICPACDYRQYPRITPCVIALVTKGEQALLGRSTRFPEGMFSCLAGFMEAGETAENAVRREVWEETGVQVGTLHYFRSQSWPFPHSLMLGFHADYAGGNIQIDDDEIVEAGWFHYEQLPDIPPRGSIARALIDHWQATLS